MITAITQFGDWIFANDGFVASLSDAGSRGQFNVNPAIATRAGATPVVGVGAVTERVIPAEFVYDPSLDPNGPRDIRDAYDLLIGKLDPTDTSPRRLIGSRHDGARVQRMAVVSGPADFDPEQSINFIQVRFTSGEARWEATSNTIASGVFIDSGQSAGMAIPNTGYATVEPVVTLQPTVTAHLSTSATVGWKNRRQVTITNNGVFSLDNRPIQIDLGDTTVWVSDGALASGNDVRFLLNGEELPRLLIGWNWPKTLAWIVPPPIAPGETVTIDIVYGNPSAGSPATLDGKLHPAFVVESDSGTATGGSTTTLTDTGKTWTAGTINWVGAYVYFLTGANAGTFKEITANTTNSVTFAAAGSAIVAGAKYLIAHSKNSRWWWQLADLFPNASTRSRGRWYLNSVTKKPRDIDFTIPGAWAPYLMQDNQDRMASISRSWSDIGLGPHAYAWLDAWRSWQTGGRLTLEDGVADGVAFYSALPILKYNSTATLANNLNSMATAVVMARNSGAEEWETLDSQTANGTIIENLTLPVDDQYFYLYAGLLPTDQEGYIRPDRFRDRGTTSSDGNTRQSTTTGGTITLRKTPSASGAAVQDNTPANVTIPNGTVVERDGWWSGSWRHIIYTTLAGDEYKGWVPVASLTSETGGTTLVDGSKDWPTNALVGATVKITGCPNKWLVGKSMTIASNTQTTITVTFNSNINRATIPQGTAYEIRQARNAVRLTDGPSCWIDFDTTNLVVSAPTSKQDVYQVAAELAVGDGGQTLFARKVSARIGLDGRKVLLRTTDTLQLDGKNRTAAIYDSTGALVQRLTDPAVLIQQVSQDTVYNRQVTARAARWLPLGVGSGLTLNQGTLVFYLKDAGWTATIADDISVPLWQTPPAPISGTLTMLNVTANTGGANSHADLLLDRLFPVAKGQRIGFACAVRTNNVNLQPLLGILWCNAGGAVIGSTYQNAWTPAANVWHPAAFVGISPDLADVSVAVSSAGVAAVSAPAAAVNAKFVVRVVSIGGSQTGKVWIDQNTGDTGFQTSAPILWYSELGGNGLSIATSYPAGYLG